MGAGCAAMTWWRSPNFGGGTEQGEIHEAMNFAGVHACRSSSCARTKVTPSASAGATGWRRSVAARAAGYGFPGSTWMAVTCWPATRRVSTPTSARARRRTNAHRSPRRAADEPFVRRDQRRYATPPRSRHSGRRPNPPPDGQPARMGPPRRCRRRGPAGGGQAHVAESAARAGLHPTPI